MSRLDPSEKSEPLKANEESDLELMREFAAHMLNILKRNSEEEDAFEMYVQQLKLRTYDNKDFKDRFANGYEILIRTLKNMPN